MIEQVKSRIEVSCPKTPDKDFIGKRTLAHASLGVKEFREIAAVHHSQIFSVNTAKKACIKYHGSKSDGRQHSLALCFKNLLNFLRYCFDFG